MQIYPAIDLRGGECVRLTQGDFNQAVTYTHTPLQQAAEFMEQGAHWLHLVDLDAAKDPNQHQLSLIKKMAAQTPLMIQTGGGIRSLHDVTQRLEAGISRVIIGSLAVKEPDIVKTLLKTHSPEHIVLALDVVIDNGLPMVATQGWQQRGEFTLHQIIERFIGHGLKHILCTDIQCDGTLLGPNFTLYEALCARYPELEVQASGGIGDLEDLRQLRKTGVSGVIIGKALYEKRFSLHEAFSC